MKNLTRNRPWKHREPRVAALILYEDKLSGLRAKLILDNVLDELGAAPSGAPELCRLDLLGSPELRKRAAKAAANADLIFLSLHGNRPVTAETIDWAYLWLHRRRKSSQALAIILDKALRMTRIVDEILYAFSFVSYAPGLSVYRGFQDLPHVAEDGTPIAVVTDGAETRQWATSPRTLLPVARRTIDL